MFNHDLILACFSSILNHKINKERLYNILKDDNLNWDNIVKTGSTHLVLPTIYSKLKTNRLLNKLPNELQDYLSKLSLINKNRNLQLLEESKGISRLFNKHKINHVFVKGIALLAGNYYADDCERMIGDIDILIEKTQIRKAQTLLLNHNYYELNKTLSDDFFEKKHLPRLVSDNKLAAVELHKKLLSKNVSTNFEIEEYLRNSKIVNDISIGNNNDLLLHVIYNCEVNDYNYYHNSVNIRSMYDYLILSEIITPNQINTINNCKYINYFIRKINVYTSKKQLNKKPFFSLKTILFNLKQNNATFDKIIYYIFEKTRISKVLINRSLYFLSNNSYRTKVINDRERIIIILKNRLFKN